MNVNTVTAIFVWFWKIVSVSVRYLFYQPMYKKIETWTLRFPAKENPNKEKALFDWPIVLQYDVKVKYRLISRKFSGMTFFHPSVCIRSINQTNRSISVCLLFLFCSHVFISRSKIALAQWKLDIRIYVELWTYGQPLIKDDSIGLTHIARELLTTSAYLVWICQRFRSVPFWRRLIKWLYRT